MPIKIFFCYAHQDDLLRDEFEKHLSVLNLKHSGDILTWYDREIQPGIDWNKEIEINLNNSDIILLLISSDFMASDYCYGVEMRRALERHKSGEARVIPIILRPVAWEKTSIGGLQVLPRNAVPVTRWADRDEAFKDIVIGIDQVSTKISIEKSNKQWIEEGNTHYYAGRYEEALNCYRRGIRHNYDDLRIYNTTLPYEVGTQYEKQNNKLPLLEQDIRFVWSDADLLTKIGSILWHRGHLSNALVAFEQAIKVDPGNSQAYIGKGLVLENLGKAEESRLCFQKAQELAQAR